MLETGTGLSYGNGKCAGNPCRINEIRPDLVFCVPDQECSHNANEISALRSELVFRDVPGKLVQRSWHSQRFRRFRLRRALVNPPGDGIARVPIAPVCLGLLTACRLTFRTPAGPLPDTHARVRPEPPATNGARSLPGLWHRDDSSSSSRLQPPGERRVRSECLGHFWKAEVGHFS
jgi:hypothetical protein